MEDGKVHSFAGAIIFFILSLFFLIVAYPQIWNSIAPLAGFTSYNGPAWFRWDLILKNRSAFQTFLALVCLLIVLTFYIGTTVNKLNNRGMKASGEEYGSARFSTNNEFLAYFDNTTIEVTQKTKRQFHIWKYILGGKK